MVCGMPELPVRPAAVPGGLSPSEFAKKIAQEMGYPVGNKYDPETAPPLLLGWLIR